MATKTKNEKPIRGKIPDSGIVLAIRSRCLELEDKGITAEIYQPLFDEFDDPYMLEWMLGWLGNDD